MAKVTAPNGDVFDVDDRRALEYYSREPGFTIGEAVPEEGVELADGTVDQVLAEVGDDPQLAAAALAAEQAKERPRTSLVDKLVAIAAAGSADAEQQ